MYHTENEEKSSVVERWSKTMKNRMWKIFSASIITVFWNKIDKLVDDYNNSRHSSIKMKPAEASEKKNEEKVWSNLYGELIYLKSKKKTQFAIGDKVRISKCKRQVFDKGYTPNWTEEAEVFVIDEVLPIKSVTCKIVDLMGEAIGGSFYEQELQKTEQEIFSIDKVLRRYNKKKIALVRWSGYPDKFNSCVSFKDLV